ncbi:FxsB family cyclophane-forming radical SAM/SPASM peptide maturase [Saccharopolyspora spinosa]|uniref:Radical SAM core domain-containing protein n=1 Tax=Saccharopolyspora spinosa TaxID=60894 RepID=A0A2N3Y6N8_SACSN|nr:FxsB family cyclophane-forming radical SAM/SPASM peptide maturase [Saccharopolyspora spinosa]PKW18596.1 uncharacterized protein A8926_6698 [Saccharopolyspora spinosa]
MDFAIAPGTDEWPASLDVDDLLALGWEPVPFRQFILKTHSRCNLACDYCFVYRMADQNWRHRPALMSAETVRQTAHRIAEHAEAHRLSGLEVVLHGGEPLLAGARRLAHTVMAVRQAVGSGTEVTASVQTNGSRLDREMLNTFALLGIRVGVSLDGGRAATDRHRRYPNGRSSYADVRHGLRLLEQSPYRELFSGLLCTVDLANDPIDVYESLLEFAPPLIDFLLPHGNWTTRPSGRPADPTVTPYADWLIAVFDRWYSAPVRQTGIRLFDEILNLLLGGGSRVESVGLSPASLIVVETDGSLEQVDSLKSAYSGAPDTRLTVFENSFDEALHHPAIAARQLGRAALSDACQQCAFRDVCGGGLYPHRYHAGSGFRNQTVYCPDLYRLIGHIRERVTADLRKLTRQEACT